MNQRRHATVEEPRALSETERPWLEAILASMSDAVLVVDGDQRVLLSNDAYARLVDAIGDRPLESDSGDPMPADAWPAARMARGEAFSMRFSVSSEAGRRWFEADGRPIADSESGGVVVIRDITERSMQRIQEEFLMTLSHELRTPLTGLTAYLEMALRRIRRHGDEKEIRYIERAVGQAHRFNGLVEELFDANRLSSGQMRYDFAQTDLAKVVDDAVAMARLIDEEREILVDPGRARLVVSGDGNRLQQVVFNLVSNALRHAPDSPQVRVRLRRRGSDAELAVEDEGPGIPADRLPLLFERLDASSPSPGHGLGLGLYISHGIVAAHGGTLRVESEEGRGTTFVVRIPLARDQLAR